MRTIKCPCGETAEVTDNTNLGTQMKESGFYPLMTNMCETVWLCRSCTLVAALHVGKLMDVLGHPKYMAMISLTQMMEKVKEGRDDRAVAARR